MKYSWGAADLCFVCLKLLRTNFVHCPLSRDLSKVQAISVGWLWDVELALFQEEIYVRKFMNIATEKTVTYRTKIKFSIIWSVYIQKLFAVIGVTINLKKYVAIIDNVSGL